MTAPLPYLLIPAKTIRVVKVSLSDMKNLRTVCHPHWLPIASIFFLIETIYSNVLGSNYLRNEKYFLIFFFAFSKLRFIFEHFQKKDDPHSLNVFLILRSPKNVVRSMSQKVPFQRTLQQVTLYTRQNTV